MIHDTEENKAEMGVREDGVIEVHEVSREALPEKDL